jgi:hypothetical protein
MKLKTIEIIRVMGIFLIASSSVVSYAMDGPPETDSQKPYCLQSAQVTGLLKSFKISEKEFAIILSKGGDEDCFNSIIEDGTGKCPQSSKGALITGPAQCSQLLEWSMWKLDDHAIDKFDQSDTVRNEIGVRRVESNEHEDFARLAVAGAKNPISCEEVKGLLQKILAAPRHLSADEKELSEYTGKSQNETSDMSGDVPSSKTIVDAMCKTKTIGSTPSGMTARQKNKMARGVAGVLPSIGVFNDANNANVKK